MKNCTQNCPRNNAREVFATPSEADDVLKNTSSAVMEN